MFEIIFNLKKIMLFLLCNKHVKDATNFQICVIHSNAYTKTFNGK